MDFYPVVKVNQERKCPSFLPLDSVTWMCLKRWQPSCDHEEMAERIVSR